MKYHKNQGIGLFDKENTLQELLEHGNPLPKLKEIIDFEQFRNILEAVFENKGKKSNAGRRGHPLTEEQKERNRQKSRVRSRVEHVFGFMEQTMGGLIFRGVGLIRAKANIALTNLVYNMCRLVQIKKYQPTLTQIGH